MMHVCDYCGSEWRSPIAAAMCCDPISADASFEETDLDGSTITRGLD